ncbi:hypothetical protein CCAX7_61670 [Capsulimonas corticalis]|uniref:Uncharacterized protein n=1 Tax=Capsulimonas corticalis TaxID=2219043 RepID=A0A402CWC7_9BACT|nr:hypothetical protein CCAX7_61670 [Capsulimonas corticalis]
MPTPASAVPTPSATGSHANTYDATDIGLTFTYPNGWFASEDSASQRINIANAQGAFNLENRPSSYELVWLSAAPYETSVEAEAHTKAGAPDCCTTSGSPIEVTSGTIVARSLVINTYKFQGTIQAYWSSTYGKRYSASIMSPGPQKDEIAILKSILATISVSQ